MKGSRFFRFCVERIIVITLCLSLLLIIIPAAYASADDDYFRIDLLGEGACADGSDLYVPVGSEIRFFFKAPGSSFSKPRDFIAVFVGKVDDLPDMLSEYVEKRGDYYRYTNHEEIDGDFLEKYLTHKGGQGFLSEIPGDASWTTYLAEKTGVFTFGVLFERYDTEHEIAESYVKEYTLHIGEHSVKPTPTATKKPYLSIDAGHINGLVADVTGGRGSTINVTSNVKWQIKENLNWVNLSNYNGNGNGSFTVYVEANNGAARDGYITVSGEACEPISIYISQPGVAKPNPATCNHVYSYDYVDATDGEWKSLNDDYHVRVSLKYKDVCTICGDVRYQRRADDGAVQEKHTFGKTNWSQYHSDEDNHWRVGKRSCTAPGCDYVDNVFDPYSKHTFTLGKCVCGYTNLSSHVTFDSITPEAANDYNVEVTWRNAPEGSRTNSIPNDGYMNVYSGNVVDNLTIRVSKNAETVYPQIAKQGRPQKGDLYWEVDDSEHKNGYSQFDGLSLSLSGTDRTIIFHLYEYTDGVSTKLVHRFLIHLLKAQALKERYVLCIMGIKNGYILDPNASAQVYSNHDMSVRNSIKLTGIGLEALEWFTKYPEIMFGVLDTETNEVYLDNSLGFSLHIAENGENYPIGRYVKLKEEDGTHTVYLKKDNLPIDELSIHAKVHFYRNEIEWDQFMDVVATGGLTLMGQYLAKSMFVFDVVTNTYMYGFDPGRTVEALIEYVEYMDNSSEGYWQGYVLEDFFLMEKEEAEVVYSLTSEFLSLLKMCDVGATFSTDGKINVTLEYSTSDSSISDVILGTISLVDTAYDTGLREIEYFLVGEILYEFGYHESGKRIMKRVERNITIDNETLIYVVDEDDIYNLKYDVTNLYCENDKDEPQCIMYIDKEARDKARSKGINKAYFNLRGVEKENKKTYRVLKLELE